YKARELWERSPSPAEDWGSDAERDFDLEVVGEEVGYGEIKYAYPFVAWKDWQRADGSSTTWEGSDSTSVHLPTSAWEAKRIAALPNTPDIQLWGTTDIANTATRERKQGYKEATEQERAKATPSMSPQRAPPPRPVSPAISISSTESIEITDYKPALSVAKQTPAPRGLKRKASSPIAAPPPLMKRRLPGLREPPSAGGSSSISNIPVARATPVASSPISTASTSTSGTSSKPRQHSHTSVPRPSPFTTPSLSIESPHKPASTSSASCSRGPPTASTSRLTPPTHSSGPPLQDRAAEIAFVNDVDDEPVPSSVLGEFEYLEDAYKLSDTLGVAVDPCDCIPDCTKVELCGCQDKTTVSAYAYTDGLFNFTYGLHQVVVECNPYCVCSMDCPNRVTQRPRKIPIEVFKTPRCGWGARASVDVEKGRVLGVYTGPRMEAKELEGLANEYCFDLDYNEEDTDELYSVDSQKCGNWTRFINHSCAPNVRVQPVVYDTLPFQHMAFLAFITTEFIPARKEFTFDYDPEAQREFDLAAAEGGKSWKPDNATECVCGASSCRGWVRT
ncbi:hypothetical protein DFH07DRAFT_756756, partial [Mycena maculata]